MEQRTEKRDEKRIIKNRKREKRYNTCDIIYDKWWTKCEKQKKRTNMTHNEVKMISKEIKKKKQNMNKDKAEETKPGTTRWGNALVHKETEQNKKKATDELMIISSSQCA